MGSNGKMVRSSWIDYAGLSGVWHRYYVGADGALYVGFKQVGADYYYFNPNAGTPHYDTQGCVLYGWHNVSGGFRYFGSDGKMLTGFRQIDGSWYYLPNGIRATGWHNVDGGFRYFGSDGKMLTYWQNIGGYRYYLGANGIRVTGFQTIDGKIYYFDSEGKMQTGWLNIGDDWYYGGQDGALYVGAHEINGVKYLFDSDGRLLYGYGSITISKIGEDIEPNQVFVYKIEGKTAYLDTEISLSFTIVGEGSVTVADIPNGKYTVTEVSACSWRYSATDGKTSEEVSLGAVDGASHSYAHTCVFTSERTNNKWLSSCSNVCQNTPAPPITNQLLNNQLYISENEMTLNKSRKFVYSE